MVYPALLPLTRTPWLPVVDWTDAPADVNGLVRFAERRNLGFCTCAITFQLASTYFVGGAPRALSVVMVMHTVCDVKILLSLCELTCQFRDEVSCCYEIRRTIRTISLSPLYVWCLWKLWISCPVMDGASHQLSMQLMLFLFSLALRVSDILKNVPDRLFTQHVMNHFL